MAPAFCSAAVATALAASVGVNINLPLCLWECVTAVPTWDTCSVMGAPASTHSSAWAGLGPGTQVCAGWGDPDFPLVSALQQKKSYLERSVKEAEDNIREMLMARRAQ